MERVDVAIVGGGVAGGAAACAFADQGLRVAVLERRSLDHDANRGDALHLEAVDSIRRWGAFESLERRGAFWVRQMAFCAPRGRPAVSVDIEDAPFLMLAHADIELALAEAAEQHGVAIHRAAVRGMSRDGDGWRVQADGVALHARLVVGADGARSTVREAAGIPCDGDDYGQATVVMHAPRPDWLDADAGWALIHRAGGVLILPTTPDGSCRVVAQVTAEALPRWRGASDNDLPWLLSDRSPMLRGLKVRRGNGSHIYKLTWQHARRYVAPGVALIGDAAHVTHPNGGQGMTMAIRDAAELAPLAGAALGNGAGPSGLRRALWEYAARRRPASAEALARADRMARFQRNSEVSYAASLALLAGFSLTPALAGRFVKEFGG
jgi:2-polyprenyl-6-methoxyphenol hydroxylase-like FAD-dependent oxidoreductase